MTRQEATTLATAINLKRGDLPGWHAKRSTSDASDKRASASLAHCAGGVPPSKDIADVDSPDFATASGGVVRQVGSTVTVLPSAALVARDLGAIRSARGRTCFQQFVDGRLAQAGTSQVTFGKARVSAFQPATADTDGAFGYRVRVVARSGGTRIPFFVDGIGFAKGPVEISLNVLSVGRPFPATAEHRLYVLLVNRAQGRAS